MINEMVIVFVTENYRAWFKKWLLFIQCLQIEGKDHMKNSLYVILKNFLSIV